MAQKKKTSKKRVSTLKPLARIILSGIDGMATIKKVARKRKAKPNPRSH